MQASTPRRLISNVLSCGLVAIAGACAAPQPVADQGDGGTTCRLCGKEIPKGAGVQATVAGASDVRTYRCIHCALTDLAAEVRDVALTARSPLSGTVIRLQRRQTAWVAEPPTTVYLILPERANECLDVHQPFVSRAEFDEYVAQHPDIAAQHPQAYTIAQYAQILEAGKP